MWDVREAMYPEKMTTEQLAEAMDEIAEAYVSYLRDIVDEECDLSVCADVLMENVLEKQKDSDNSRR